MIALLQRVEKARIIVDGKEIASIGNGLLILVGIKTSDTSVDADYLAKKILGLRIFNDQEGKMNISVTDTGGEILVVSQFTLLGDCRKGRRPDYIQAATPTVAKSLSITLNLV